jgi:metal transporter CNNM
MSGETLTWIGISLLVMQSGTFSGLNLAMFGLSALRLQVLANLGDPSAARLLAMRKDSNFVLTTVLWGNVGTNVLLALLSDSVMTGVIGFLFSTFVITIGGEIVPQAYFSRNALRMATLMSPFLRFYQVLLYPLARPSALLLDSWLGKESIDYLPEAELRAALRAHARAGESDISRVEGTGAINFKDLDDLLLTQEGNAVDPESVIHLPFSGGKPIFPPFVADRDDPFIESVRRSGKRWVLLMEQGRMPAWSIDASSFLRALLIRGEAANPMDYCHRPIIVDDEQTPLSEVLTRLQTEPYDDKLRRDVILLWAERKRIITGSDLLGFLMRGIARRSLPG